MLFTTYKKIGGGKSFISQQFQIEIGLPAVALCSLCLDCMYNGRHWSKMLLLLFIP